jgi:hypothetical protein
MKSSRSTLAGIARLATDATTGAAEVVEAMHQGISIGQPRATPGRPRRTRGITGFVYRAVRRIARGSGRGAEALLAWWAPPPREGAVSRRREAVAAALNGVTGHHLDATDNPLALEMCFRRGGRRLSLDRASLAEAYPDAGGRLLVLLHGLCMNDLQWTRRGHDHGAALQADLGYTPVYLRYNTGRHTSLNGREFAALMEDLVREWPVPISEIAMVGHSMGGLVARSACHVARMEGQGWIGRLRKLVFLGTPHHGAPLERAGNRLHRVLAAAPYTGPLATLGAIRSAGITDLRFGNVVDQDWSRGDRFEPGGDPRAIVPLPDGVECYAAAATTGRRRGDLRDRLLGDGLVPVDSALGPHRGAPGRSLEIPESHQWVGYRMGHLDLLSRPEVYQQLRLWLA